MDGVGLSEVLLSVGMFVATFLLSLVVVGFLLVWMPATFFLDHHDRNLWVDHHPVVRWTGLLVKNLAGLVLMAVGLLLAVPGIPGQGLLTMLVGLVLLDLPGKRQLERKLIGRPRILRMVNRLRVRFGKPRLVLKEDSSQK